MERDGDADRERLMRSGSVRPDCLGVPNPGLLDVIPSGF